MKNQYESKCFGLYLLMNRLRSWKSIKIFRLMKKKSVWRQMPMLCVQNPRREHDTAGGQQLPLLVWLLSAVMMMCPAPATALIHLDLLPTRSSPGFRRSWSRGSRSWSSRGRRLRRSCASCRSRWCVQCVCPYPGNLLYHVVRMVTSYVQSVKKE